MTVILTAYFKVGRPRNTISLLPPDGATGRFKTGRPRSISPIIW